MRAKNLVPVSWRQPPLEGERPPRKEHDMNAARNPMTAVDQAFREHALVLGGLVALGRISDEAVWQLTHSLRATRLRALRLMRLPDYVGDERVVDSRPHPAIAQFLKSLGEA